MGLFSGVAGVLGLGGANISNPVSPAQAAQSYEDVQNALKQQQSFIQALQGQNGLQNQSSVFNQQQALAGQLGQQAQGQGPNPAQAQLNQATGQNVANQAALMAGQRGASSNPGLIARQVGQQGGAIQQQAVGQGATLQAQQQLAAQEALQRQQGMMAGVANTQVGQQQGAINAYETGALGQQGNLLGAQNAYNNSLIQNQGMSNQVTGGLLGGLGSAAIMGAMKAAPAAAVVAANKGGEICYSEGGAARGFDITAPQMKSFIEKHLNSPVRGEMLAAQGKVVPGQANVKGDSIKNDTVPARLSPGEIVIPRSIAQHPEAPEKAKAFVAAIMAKKGLR